MPRARSMALALLSLAPFGLYLACSDEDEAKPGTTFDGGSSSGSLGDIPDGGIKSDGAVSNVTTVSFDPDGDGDPSSLYWDDTEKALYVADNRHYQIWKWSGNPTDPFTKFARFPDDEAATDAGITDVGQLVRLDDGTFVVPRFGFREVSGIMYVKASSGESGVVEGIPRKVGRVALARRGRQNGDEMWGGTFLRGGSNDDAGVVTKVTLTEELPYAAGFQKPVAVIELNGRLIVSDQTRGLLYALPLDAGPDGVLPPYDVYATITSPDTLAEGPESSLFTGQFAPLQDGGPLQIRQIFTDGRVSIVPSDVELVKPRGVAYDKTNKRLFVADSNASTVRVIRIFKLN